MGLVQHYICWQSWTGFASAVPNAVFFYGGHVNLWPLYDGNLFQQPRDHSLTFSTSNGIIFVQICQLLGSFFKINTKLSKLWKLIQILQILSRCHNVWHGSYYISRQQNCHACLHFLVTAPKPLEGNNIETYKSKITTVLTVVKFLSGLWTLLLLHIQQVSGQWQHDRRNKQMQSLLIPVKHCFWLYVVGLCLYFDVFGILVQTWSFPFGWYLSAQCEPWI